MSPNHLESRRARLVTDEFMILLSLDKKKRDWEGNGITGFGIPTQCPQRRSLFSTTLDPVSYGGEGVMNGRYWNGIGNKDNGKE